MVAYETALHFFWTLPTFCGALKSAISLYGLCKIAKKAEWVTDLDSVILRLQHALGALAVLHLVLLKSF